MSQNHASLRGLNENLLNTKIKSFRQNYSQSLQRNKQQSSLQMLASTVYSRKRTKELAHTKRSPSAHNPQNKFGSTAMKGLSIMVEQVPNLSDVPINLAKKRNLQQKILYIKKQIAKQTRLRNKCQQNWKRYENQKNNCNEFYQELLKKSNKLNQDISEVRTDCQQLKNQIKELAEMNSDKTKNIHKEQLYVEQMENRTRQLKAHLLNEQKHRNFVKSQLLKQQRVMNSASIQTKQLQNERAMVLLQINASVLKHKL